jgi:hypothetical protein
MKTRVLAWWSGGITSALACYWAIQVFKNVLIVFIDTGNESDDTERFLKDCEKLYGQEIIRTSNPKNKNIKEVWRKYLSLNTAHGAICSTVLKREVREAFQNLFTDYAQVFGFDSNEPNRHANMRRNYPELNVISPLVDLKISKAQATREMIRMGVRPPAMYEDFENNNCDKTGCVRGGIGYWQAREKKRHESFIEMAALEHELTDEKGEPVTILRDQTNARKGEPIFLRPHPKYPQYQSLADKKGREPEPLIECNGFCSTKD